MASSNSARKIDTDNTTNPSLLDRPLPQGFEVSLGADARCTVRLRRRLGRGEAIGLSISTRSSGRISHVDQYDIVPSLSGDERKIAEARLIEAYYLLASVDSYELGLAKLNQTHGEGIFAKCRFSPVSI